MVDWSYDAVRDVLEDPDLAEATLRRLAATGLAAKHLTAIETEMVKVLVDHLDDGNQLAGASLDEARKLLLKLFWQVGTWLDQSIRQHRDRMTLAGVSRLLDIAGTHDARAWGVF